mmetsp:Transcript_11734/g.38622  ORF Transcript_11734/g.38622 Transcript_11734/m.38622 type:complete len:363 (+) Transcript_11734:694-1782(+)
MILLMAAGTGRATGVCGVSLVSMVALDASASSSRGLGGGSALRFRCSRRVAAAFLQSVVPRSTRARTWDSGLRSVGSCSTVTLTLTKAATEARYASKAAASLFFFAARSFAWATQTKASSTSASRDAQRASRLWWWWGLSSSSWLRAAARAISTARCFSRWRLQEASSSALSREAASASSWFRSFAALTRRSFSTRSKNARVFRSSRDHASRSAVDANRNSRDAPTDATTRPTFEEEAPSPAAAANGLVGGPSAAAAAMEPFPPPPSVVVVSRDGGTSTRQHLASSEKLSSRVRYRRAPSAAVSLIDTVSQVSPIRAHAFPRRASRPYLCWIRRNRSASWPRYFPSSRDASPERTFSGFANL